MFFALVFRLAAYAGAVASVVAHQQGGGSAAKPRRVSRGQGGYDRNSGMVNNARTAEVAPPATAASLAALNSQMGGGWFTHRTLKGEVVKDGAGV